MFFGIKTRFCKRSVRRRLSRVSPSRRNILFKNFYKLSRTLHVNIQYMKIKLNSSANVPDKNQCDLPNISVITELNSCATRILISARVLGSSTGPSPFREHIFGKIFRKHSRHNSHDFVSETCTLNIRLSVWQHLIAFCTVSGHLRPK